MSWLSSLEIAHIKAQLKIDEGYVAKVYVDSLGYKTFGKGHLIKESDLEYKLDVGAEISQERIDSAFEGDFIDAAALTKDIFPKCTTWPSEVKEIIVNMTFNLGNKLKQFKNLAIGLENRDWKKAAAEMENSKWYGQVKGRAVRLVARMRAVTDK